MTFSPPVSCQGKETIHVQDQEDVLRSSRMMKARQLQSCFTWHLANATASLMFIRSGGGDYSDNTVALEYTPKQPSNSAGKKTNYMQCGTSQPFIQTGASIYACILLVVPAKCMS